MDALPIYIVRVVHLSENRSCLVRRQDLRAMNIERKKRSALYRRTWKKLLSFQGINNRTSLYPCEAQIHHRFQNRQHDSEQVRKFSIQNHNFLNFSALLLQDLCDAFRLGWPSKQEKLKKLTRTAVSAERLGKSAERLGKFKYALGKTVSWWQMHSLKKDSFMMSLGRRWRYVLRSKLVYSKDHSV